MRYRRIAFKIAPLIIAKRLPFAVPRLVSTPRRKIPKRDPYVMLVRERQSHRKSLCSLRSQAMSPRIIPNPIIWQREIN